MRRNMTHVQDEEGTIITINSVTAVGTVQCSKWAKPKATEGKGIEGTHHWFWVYTGAKSFKSKKFNDIKDAEKYRKELLIALGMVVNESGEVVEDRQ